MRPVLSRSGRAAPVSLRSDGISGATKRPLPSLVRSRLSQRSARRRLRLRAPATARAQGVERLVESEVNAPMSKSRLPSFSNAESAACSRKISAAEL
jgi:hypothetical protein